MVDYKIAQIKLDLLMMVYNHTGNAKEAVESATIMYAFIRDDVNIQGATPQPNISDAEYEVLRRVYDEKVEMGSSA